ncbi:MAG TPA: poly(R)-hydroxyalkanoic acid synthase subunit PhaE [Candidatus Ozemobacteraceae bacterium]|nr:poly(R)-hydroxyalkanoic acid synthase subunit PhaE [Candidatus Ozemobacteraceae bacterium]
MTNPFDFGRTMMESWEKTMTESFERLSKDENFIKTMSQAMTHSLDLRKQMGTQIEAYLKSINMPSKTDLERMFGYLQRIESKLLDLEDQLAELRAAGPQPAERPAAKPAAPRKKPAKKA